MEGVTKEEQMRRLASYFSGFYAVWIVDLGKTLGLFREIKGLGWISAPALAERLKLSRNYVESWAQAAYSYEILDYQEGKGFSLGPHMDGLLLNENDPHYFAGHIHLAVESSRDYFAFRDLFRTGVSIPFSDRHMGHITGICEATRPNFHYMCQTIRERIPRLERRLQEGARVLDVGCGCGGGLLYCADIYRSSTFHGVDVDATSINQALRLIGESPWSDRISVEKVAEEQLPRIGEFDLAYMDVVLHEAGGEEEKVLLLENVKKALKDDGHLIVMEIPMLPMSRARSHMGQIINGIQLDEVLIGTSLMTLEEIRDVILKAGYGSVEECETGSDFLHFFHATK